MDETFRLFIEPLSRFNDNNGEVCIVLVDSAEPTVKFVLFLGNVFDPLLVNRNKF